MQNHPLRSMNLGESFTTLYNFGINVKTRLMLRAFLQNSSISQICKNAHLWKMQ